MCSNDKDALSWSYLMVELDKKMNKKNQLQDMSYGKLKPELQLIAQHNLLDPQNKSFVLVFHSAKGTTFQKNLLI